MSKIGRRNTKKATIAFKKTDVRIYYAIFSKLLREV